MEPLVVTGAALCWIVLSGVWAVTAWRDRAAAVRTASAQPVVGNRAGALRQRRRRRAVPVLGAALILVAGLSLASAIAAIFSDDLLPSGVIIRSSWLQIPGLALLVISAAFAVWARLALGFVELKIYREERLLLATFPDEYPRYRSRVPQLVPGLGAVQRKADPA